MSKICILVAQLLFIRRKAATTRTITRAMWCGPVCILFHLNVAFRKSAPELAKQRLLAFSETMTSRYSCTSGCVVIAAIFQVGHLKPTRTIFSVIQTITDGSIDPTWPADGLLGMQRPNGFETSPSSIQGLAKAAGSAEVTLFINRQRLD